jgi:hypothetical protein
MKKQGSIPEIDRQGKETETPHPPTPSPSLAEASPPGPVDENLTDGLLESFELFFRGFLYLCPLQRLSVGLVHKSGQAWGVSTGKVPVDEAAGVNPGAGTSAGGDGREKAAGAASLRPRDRSRRPDEEGLRS